MQNSLIIIAVIFFASVNCWFFKSKKAWPVTAYGCVRCLGQPVPFVRILLKDKDGSSSQTMKIGRTAENGCFRLSGKGKDGFEGKPDPYMQVDWSYNGQFGRLEVKGTDKSRVKDYSASINFGTINYVNVECKTYLVFYEAMKDYKTRTGLSLPYHTLTVSIQSISIFEVMYTLNQKQPHNSLCLAKGTLKK